MCNKSDISVTILIPVYGVERYIGECAESLFKQTYADIEYVFVDDCTPDASISVLMSVLGQYSERRERVHIVRHEHNMGLGAARCTGLKHVKTDCFCIVDSDDILPVDAIETLVTRMQETKADIVEGAYQNYGGGSLGSVVVPFHGSQSDYQRKLLCQNVVKNNVWAKLYRTYVTERITDLFEPGIDYAEDYSATTRLAMVTQRAWTDKVVYHYRTDNASSYTSGMSRKNVISCLKATNRILKFCHWRGHLPLAAEVGMLNMYRVCHRNGVAQDEADELLRYVPQNILATVVFHLFHSGTVGYYAGDAIYRILRLICA